MNFAPTSDFKTCFKCFASLPHSEFYKHSAMADGLLGKCKTCSKADSAKHRLENIEKVREYDRKRNKDPKRRKLAADLAKIWCAEDRRRSKSHKAVAQAVRIGALIRLPCEVCVDSKSVAHHDSYDKPLQVMWLCAVHHRARHKELAAKGIEP